MSITALRWIDPPSGPAIELLDQTRLPLVETTLTCTDVPTLIDAIRRLAVRGAPLLGIAGAYGVALAAARGDDVPAAAAAIERARPTAVNLGWAARLTLDAYLRALDTDKDHEGKRIAALAALRAAQSIEEADRVACDQMAAAGLTLVPDGAKIMTHCNTGALVTAGHGTAFGLIKHAQSAGKLAMLWIDETRPLLQGARLTAYEAKRAGMPYRVLADSAAASLMAAGEVDLVAVGADRIAADGSVANKVGTYSLAVLARHHRVPFVVVAPVSTIDFGTADGKSIVIEERAPHEVTELGGQPIAPVGSAAYNPAFDVTPPDLVTAIVTERGVIQPVTEGNLRVLGQEP
ncbi:MAG TPA: S-methyl-5-thioribose-1-phosphate isomerase [Streptosporangiaceae bacterium]|nr:S-methyl-5-thioribose-1-phosphate isomerase [Streptosporangiaceae bacterium]